MDFLVVAVNDLPSLRTKKGANRPRDPRRLEVLASIKDVDVVVLFDGGEKNLIDKWRPRVYAKGADTWEDYDFSEMRRFCNERHVRLITIQQPRYYEVSRLR